MRALSYINIYLGHQIIIDIHCVLNSATLLLHWLSVFVKTLTLVVCLHFSYHEGQSKPKVRGGKPSYPHGIEIINKLSTHDRYDTISTHYGRIVNTSMHMIDTLWIRYPSVHYVRIVIDTLLTVYQRRIIDAL